MPRTQWSALVFPPLPLRPLPTLPLRFLVWCLFPGPTLTLAAVAMILVLFYLGVTLGATLFRLPEYQARCAAECGSMNAAAYFEGSAPVCKCTSTTSFKFPVPGGE